MAKKLILLILIIPIILMVVLFMVTKTVSNLVEVPVKEIEIFKEPGFEDEPYPIDMDLGETYSLVYAVYPTNAHNKDVTVTTEPIGENKLASFDFVPEEGKVKVIPKTAGLAKVTLTTIDGGFRSSMNLHVISTKLESIDCRIPETTLIVGDKATITTEFTPENPSNTIVNYSSSNNSVATVDKNGIITARGRGVATITVISEFNESIRDTIEVTVKNRDAMDLGINNIETLKTIGSIPISIASDDAIDSKNIAYKFFDKDGNPVSESTVKATLVKTDSGFSLNYTLSEEFVGDLLAEITFTHGETVIIKECKISKVEEIKATFDNSIFEMNVGQTVSPTFTVTPEDIDFTCVVTTDNDNVTAKMLSSGKLAVTAKKAGITKLTLKIKTSDIIEQELVIECTVFIKPAMFVTKGSDVEYGIEKILTIGKYQYSYENGAQSLVDTYGTDKAFKLEYSVPKNKTDLTSTAGIGFAENVIWRSSAPEAVTIDKDGKIHVLDDDYTGIVEFYAEFAYDADGDGKTDASMITDKVKIRCVGSGVNVYSYRDLYYATESCQIVVLHSNIKDDFGYIDGEIKYSEIHTTYNDTYYKNLDKEDEAKVKVLISFKEDIYGNGHVINAHNVTYKLTQDGAGNDVAAPNFFEGPLNFIMATHTNPDNGAISTISVKAQDNICFALYEGVTVNNVELRGCDLEETEDGKHDLTHLNYIGTVAEVLGDDVNIEYSRLTNGRTVLRAFGDISDSEKEIHVSISNSVLSGAREFIMRVGSNRFKEGTKDTPSPNLDSDKGTDYDTKKTYNKLTANQKEAYDEKYINTFVTVKNSVFKDTGLFAIGMDSHFAGKALEDSEAVVNQFKQLEGLLNGWEDLARTSYGAKVSFDGDVELYNWKPVDDVDSSTLIEITGNFSIFNNMAFDVKGMITELSKQSDYSNIVTRYNNKNMVHAGIAFFGGGKNYCVFEAKNGTVLNNYNMSFDDIGRSELTWAAGEQPFYFFLYDKTSSFSPKVQEEKLKTGEAYECIYK